MGVGAVDALSEGRGVVKATRPVWLVARGAAGALDGSTAGAGAEVAGSAGAGAGGAIAGAGGAIEGAGATGPWPPAAAAA
jgi:hypothetical protein